MAVIRLLVLLGLAAGSSAAEVPPLLATAIAHWDEGAAELAFTQETRTLRRDGSLQQVRIERYDPSLPDQRRWRLLSVDGREPTADERRRIEDRRNHKPRREPLKPLGEYLDLSTARVLPADPDASAVRYLVGVNQKHSSVLVPADKMVFTIAVDPARADITHLDATLTEPMRILFGLATVHDLDIDINVKTDDLPDATAGTVTDDSTAEATISKFGQPLEFTWSDFQRVEPYRS